MKNTIVITAIILMVGIGVISQLLFYKKYKDLKRLQAPITAPICEPDTTIPPATTIERLYKHLEKQRTIQHIKELDDYYERHK